jgi:glucan phosphoethanolaminetransferase (alkaline phosphatase superfamily)
MRFLPRPAHLYIVLSYLVLSAVPFAPWLFGHGVEHPWQIIGTELICWVAAWALSGRPARFHWLLLPAFLALPMQLYLFAFYGQGISSHQLGVVVETSPAEAIEFLGQKIWLMLAVFVAMLAWWASSWRAAWTTRDLDWTDGSRAVALGALVLGGAVLAYGQLAGVAPPALPPVASAGPVAAVHRAALVLTKASAAPAAGAAAPPPAPARHALPLLPRWASMPVDAKTFGTTWPFGLAAVGLDFYRDRAYLADLTRESANFHFGAHPASPQDKRGQLVVLVIGESSRYDRWSLNGYARQTNPLLAQQANLVTLPDVITSVSATRLSVPVIISRKPAMKSLKDGFAEKSFISAFKEAGYKTFWISNQISFGKFDTPVSVFAKEADVVEFLNLGDFRDESSLDDVMLAPLKNAVADPAPKKLVVLHTLGSHWNYSHRYPARFDKWLPSLYGVDHPVYTDLKNKQQMNNSYDSSILYTDWVLSHVIDTIKGSGEAASMVYVADHGQTLYDGTCKIAFHGHNTQYEFHVPAFVWYSDQYRERFPEKIGQLLRHRGEHLATENMFHTLLDLGDIRYPGDRLEWSFVNSQFKLHKRYVDSYGWTDYDNAVLKGDCREVISKGKPLPRR